MGIDDLFEDDHKKHDGYRNQRYEKHHDQSDYRNRRHNKYDNFSSPVHGNYTYKRNDNHINIVSILEKLRGNRKLKFLIIGVGVLLVSIVIILLIFLLPIFMKLFSWVSQNGLQGLIDSVTTIIDKFLNGTK